LLVWAEAGAREKLAEVGVTGTDRNELLPHDVLVIWTTPPGGAELRYVLEIVSPQVVYLFAVDPQMDELEPFIKRLIGLVKYALKSNQGLAKISVLAAATAQREATVKTGIDWLEARGDLGVQFEDEDRVCFSEGGGSPKEDLSRLTEQLRALLAETAAFRAYYSRAKASVLVEPFSDE